MEKRKKYSSYEFWLFGVLPWVLCIGAITYGLVLYLLGKGDMNSVRVVVFTILASRLIAPTKVLIFGIKEKKASCIVRACIAYAVIAAIVAAEIFFIANAEQAAMKAASLKELLENTESADYATSLQHDLNEQSSLFLKWLIAAGVAFILQIFNEIALPDVQLKKETDSSTEQDVQIDETTEEKQ